jgi:heterodisulfide reductase subunit A-like polyferredoxin
MRTYGKDFEKYYNRAEEEAGVRFIKSRITNILPVKETGNLLIRYTDEAGKRVEEEFDMVVLSVGLGVPKEAVELAKRLEIELDSYQYASTSSLTIQTSTALPVSAFRSKIFLFGRGGLRRHGGGVSLRPGTMTPARSHEMDVR